MSITDTPLSSKKDERPQRHGWAPGSYMRKCYACDTTFIGDKRAVTCADCAYKDAPTSDAARKEKTE